eukprot:2694982-Rhodomonas_salina.1
MPHAPSTPSELATTHLLHSSTPPTFKAPSRPLSFLVPPSSAGPNLPFYPRRPLPRTAPANKVTPRSIPALHQARPLYPSTPPQHKSPFRALTAVADVRFSLQ